MKVYENGLSEEMIKWIYKQHIFFVGSAPLAGEFVNVSPKGLANTFQITSPKQVMYLDQIGSGNETFSHLNESGNGRICVMFCNFEAEGGPKIIRMHAKASYLLSGTKKFQDTLSEHFDLDQIPTGVYRGLIVADAFQVSQSCGKGIPLFDFVEHREDLGKGSRKYAENPKFNKMLQGWNSESLDGLPGLTDFSKLFVHNNDKMDEERKLRKESMAKQQQQQQQRPASGGFWWLAAIVLCLAVLFLRFQPVQ